MSTQVQIIPDSITTMVANYWDRLKPALDAKGWGIQQFADAIGVSYQAVVKVRDGGSFGSKNNIKAAKALGLDPAWLATGDGSPKFGGIESNVEPALELKKSRRVPITGSVKGGDDGYLVQDNGTDGWVDYWTGDPRAYALRVRGDSMHPRYRSGEFVVVTPSIEAQPGRDVVVQLKNGKCLLKELGWRRDDEVQLRSINNGYTPMTVMVDEIESICRVAGAVGSDSMVF